MGHPGIDALLERVGLDPTDDVAVKIDGRDPVLPSPFPVAEAAAIALGALGAAVAGATTDRTADAPTVNVSVRRAAAGLRAYKLQRLDGGPVDSLPWKSVSGYHECADGRWLMLCAPLPHLIDGTLRVLGCANDAEAITRAAARWSSFELEAALAGAGQCGVVARTADEWRAHPQGMAIAPHGAVAVEKIGESTPEPLPATYPLDGIRVLDLTRILAGPMAGRHLADLGADVLLVNSPNLENVPDTLVETSHGKRSALLDLDRDDDAATLRSLVRRADVFSDGYRSGALERRGFGAEDLAALRPGIVSVSVNCYGDVGPWRGRPGFEPIAQSATGIGAAIGGSGRPGAFPAPVCDYVTGCLAALGTVAALRRRAVEGGSYRVRASLAQTAMWVERMGTRCDPADASGFGDLTPWTVREHTAYGELEHLRSPLELSTQPVGWRRPAVPPGTDPPEFAR